MRRWRRSAAEAAHALLRERGSASLEFITCGLVLLVPLVYLVIALASLQAASLAAEGAARQAARVYVDQPTRSAASASAERAVLFALADYGFTRDQAAVDIGCRPALGDCLARRGAVTVTVRVSAPLPLVPDVLNVREATTIPVQAEATQLVPRFGGAP